MIVTLDTNVVASATFWRGKPAHCLEGWALGRFELAVSHAILTEYEEVICRLGARYAMERSTDWLTAIRRAARVHFPSPSSVQISDPDDQIFLDCAVSANADYLVTGDKAHLLTLKQAVGVLSLSARIA